MLATFAAGALLNLDSAAFLRLEIGLLIGTPGLAALGLAVAALTASLRASGALIGLVMLPLAVPLLIFGASAGPNALKLLGATSLLFVAGAPFVAGAALRAGRT
jgi:heme exporter protein B